MNCAGIEGFTNVAHTHIEAALPVLKRNGVPLLVHAEVVDDRAPKACLPLHVSAMSYQPAFKPVYEASFHACNLGMPLANRTDQYKPKASHVLYKLFVQLLVYARDTTSMQVICGHAPVPPQAIAVQHHQ